MGTAIGLEKWQTRETYVCQQGDGYWHPH